MGTMMQSSLLSLLLLLSLVAVALVHGAHVDEKDSTKDKWDLMGLPSKVTLGLPGFKHNEHENQLTRAIRAWHVKQQETGWKHLGIDESMLIKGIRFNDMPTETELTATQPLDPVTFVKEFMLRKEHSVVTQSHYGCLQTWHSMAPKVMSDKKQAFSNDQVKVLIRKQLAKWWNEAITIHRGLAPGISHERRHLSSFKIGNIIHTIQDSFSPAHTLRGGEVLFNDHVPRAIQHHGFPVKLGCGKVYAFYGYDMQASSRHGDVDHTPVAGTREHILHMCSIFYTHQVLRRWEACAKKLTRLSNSMQAELQHVMTPIDENNPRTGVCSFDESMGPLFDVVYHLALGPIPAGGTAFAFLGKVARAKYQLEKKKYSTVTLPVRMGPLNNWMWKNVTKSGKYSEWPNICISKVRPSNSSAICGVKYIIKNYPLVRNNTNWANDPCDKPISGTLGLLSKFNQRIDPCLELGGNLYMKMSGECECTKCVGLAQAIFSKKSATCDSSRDCAPVSGPKRCRHQCKCGESKINECVCVQPIGENAHCVDIEPM
eukprot:TRINITY_DN65584_c0_g5_i1.p1 TRINITY_DN65584_c0_g5~~TRINITY_DN65584_c0_g5_i1.p1  ORF type:complete len:552 (+),score=246.55 TRINITY_DN65584_c0_g5_i1:30-1658(+)